MMAAYQACSRRQRQSHPAEAPCAAGHGMLKIICLKGQPSFSGVIRICRPAYRRIGCGSSLACLWCHSAACPSN